MQFHGARADVARKCARHIRKSSINRRRLKLFLTSPRQRSCEEAAIQPGTTGHRVWRVVNRLRCLRSTRRRKVLKFDGRKARRVHCALGISIDLRGGKEYTGRETARAEQETFGSRPGGKLFPREEREWYKRFAPKREFWRKAKRRNAICLVSLFNRIFRRREELCVCSSSPWYY